MLYRFAGFTLNTETNELHHQKQIIPLTRQTHRLLAYLLAHPEQIHTKDELIEHVWNGRIVSDNTVDQSISKLRKLLSEYESGEHIETVYGQGIKWNPRVTTGDAVQSISWKPWLVTAVMLLAFLSWWWFPANHTHQENKPQLLFIGQQNQTDWSQTGAEQMISQILSYTGAAAVRADQQRPRFADQQAYLASQRSFNPQLITASTTVQERQGYYELTVTLNGPGLNQQHTFSADNLSQLMHQATNWLNDQLSSAQADSDISHLIPQQGHVTELYFRALNSIRNNEHEKALKQLELVAEEEPGFLLGRFQLAHVMQLMNKTQESLALLEALGQLKLSPDLHIAVSSLQAYVLDTVGEYEQSARIYQSLFTDQHNQVSPALLKAGYEYAYTLLNRNQPAAAEQQLDWVLLHLGEHTDPGLQADVHALKGSLLQRQGDMQKATSQLQQALDMFERNSDALGTAKTYSAMARIANHQANYALAETYLQESLAITREVGFRLGEGATLNELAYLLMVRGEHNRARQLVQELLKIGSEIEYPAMQLAARQLFFDMAREQGDWREAERHLQQHHTLAEAIGHQRALVKNQMLELTLRVDAEQWEQTPELITALQQHINEQQETRMQPRLDWLSARIKAHNQQFAAAEQQLEQALVLASQSEDGESIININNTLAAIHLQQGHPDKALQRLEGAAAFKPFALPHLRLKARAHQAMGDAIKALETMTLCQQQAADLWTEEDAALLLQLTREAQAAMSATEA